MNILKTVDNNVISDKREGFSDGVIRKKFQKFWLLFDKIFQIFLDSQKVGKPKQPKNKLKSKRLDGRLKLKEECFTARNYKAFIKSYPQELQ